MRALLWLTVVAGCGGRVGPPTEAAPERRPAQVGRAAGEPRSPRAAIVQAVLQHPRVTPFLHPEVPGRVPVRVFLSPGEELAGEVSLFGAPVVVTRDDDALVGLRVQLSVPRARVELWIDAEGVRGLFDLEDDGSGWRVTRATVAER